MNIKWIKVDVEEIEIVKEVKIFKEVKIMKKEMERWPMSHDM